MDDAVASLPRGAAPRPMRAKQTPRQTAARSPALLESMAAIGRGPVTADAPAPDRTVRACRERSMRAAENAAFSQPALRERALPALRLPGKTAGGDGGSDVAPAAWIVAKAARPAAGPPRKKARCPAPMQREAMAPTVAGPRAQKPSTTAQLPWVRPGSGGASNAAMREGSEANFSVAAAVCKRAWHYGSAAINIFRRVKEPSCCTSKKLRTSSGAALHSA
jgi:hypothetical protein